MLYLRTGANGSCKSLFTLEDVRAKQVKELRPVCIIIGKPATQNEPEDLERRYLKIKPEKMAEFGWTTCLYKDWWSQPDGTIFLADECHNYLPKRANGSAVPEYVAKLAEHRARGFDFFLLTQHPSNIDSFVVKLIGAPGWHQHLKRVAGGSTVTSVIQWDAVNNQCEKAGAGKNAQVTMRGQPKEVYGWYESAELHTGKVRIPRAAIFLAVAAVLIPTMLGGAGYMLWNRTVGKTGEQEAAAAKTANKAGPVSSGRVGTTPEAKARSAYEYVSAYHPRVEGLRHTAPVYDELTKPARVPVPAACMSMGDKCKCYTQDATVYTTTLDLCRQIVKNGLWLEFKPEGQQEAKQAPAGPLVTVSAAASGSPGQMHPQQEAQAPGLIVFPDMTRSSGRPDAKVDAVGAQAQPQSRVPASSPWSFQTGR